MKVKLDLHMHSCLSPCGDNDMTPYNLVNMSKLMGYDMIALTDHNSCLNCEAAIKAGNEAGLTVIPGMELCTSEEIHNVCLFPDLNLSLKFSDFIRSTMPEIDNKTEIYGEQLIMDDTDNIIGCESRLLTLASSISEDDLVKTVSEYGGVCFPAHLDRASYSILSVLGFLYPELGFTAAGFSRKAFIPMYIEKHPLLSEMKTFKNCDAHYLEEIPEPMNVIELEECSAKAIIDYIGNK